MSRQADDLFDDEVTTGATLASGTTIGGNTAFHLGNDGQGSGLDAETVDAIVPVTKSKKYKKDLIKGGSVGAVWDSFNANDSYLFGMGSDSNDSIWTTHTKFDSTSSIYKVDRGGNIQTQFNAPSSNPRGCTVTDNDDLYVVDDNLLKVQQLNKSDGSVQSEFSAPSSDPKGLGFESETNHFWIGGGSDNIIHETDFNGTVQSQFTGYEAYGSGIDSSGCIWITDPGGPSIYQVDQNGNEVRRLSPEASRPRDTTVTSDSSIWYAENATNTAYGLLRNGNKSEIELTETN